MPPIVRKYGYFECPECENTWESAYVYCIMGTRKVYWRQQCRLCQTWRFPSNTEPVSCSRCHATDCECLRERRPETSGQHRSDLCQKCQEGFPCLDPGVEDDDEEYDMVVDDGEEQEEGVDEVDANDDELFNDELVDDQVEPIEHHDAAEYAVKEELLDEVDDDWDSRACVWGDEDMPKYEPPERIVYFAPRVKKQETDTLCDITNASCREESCNHLVQYLKAYGSGQAFDGDGYSLEDYPYEVVFVESDLELDSCSRYAY